MASSERVIRVVIDPTQARQGAAQANAALASIGSTAQRSTGSLNQANMAMTGMNRSAGGLGQSMRAANQNFDRSNNSLMNMARSLGRATIALGGLTLLTGGVTGLAVALTGAADKAALLDGKLRIATKSQDEFAAASSAVRRIANETRGDLTAVGDLYSKMARNAGTLGISTAGVGTATKTFSQILAVSSATAGQAEAAILQLGQAMSKGVLNGDEFSSLSENASEFMTVLAQSMGVSIGQLKALGAQGKLTGAEIAKALTDPKIVADIEARFGQIPVTFQNVRTGISNALVDIAGAITRGLGINDSLAVMLANIQSWTASALPYFTAFGQQIKGVFAAIAPVARAAFAVLGPVIGALANNLQSVVRVALAVGAGFVAMKASMGLAGVIAQVTGLGVSMGATGGLSAVFAGGMTMARNAMNGFTAALLANPLTAILTGLTVGIALLVQFSDKIKLPGQEFGRLNDIVAVLWGDFVRGVGNTINGIVRFGNAVKSVFQAFTAIGRAAFSAVVSVATGVFNRLNAMTGGFLGRAVSALSGIVDAFSSGFDMISSVWSNLPGTIGAIVTATANGVIGGIESMVNAAIGGLNRLIGMANRLPNTNIATIGDVAFGRIDASYGGSVMGRAESRGRGRVRGSGQGANAASAAAAAISAPVGGAGGGGGAGASAGETDAERQAKAIKEYWEGLEQSRDAAGLLGGELERHNALLEYRKILGDGDLANARALTAEETSRISGLLTETATRKAIADLTQSSTEMEGKNALLRERGLLIGTMTTDQLNDEMAVRERLGSLAASLLESRADMTNTELQSALALEEARLRENQQLERGNKLLEDRASRGRSLLEGYERERNPRTYAMTQRGDRDSALLSIKAAPGEDPAAFQRRIASALEDSAREFQGDLNEISNKWRNEMLDAVDQIADGIGGKFGEIISQLGRAWDAISRSAQGDQSGSGLLGGISRLFGGVEGKRNAFGQAVDSQTAKFTPTAIMDAFKNPAASLKSSFENFSSIFKTGGLVKGLGSAFGSAIQGANIGSAIGGVGKMLWSKFSNTGSQIGGAIGSIFGGPIGSVLGSIGGGILGGLFGKKKAPSASSTVSMGSGGLTALTSGSKELQGEAGQASGKVIEGINAIAARLGVNASGLANVSIGKFKDEWKVGTNGQAVGKKSGQSFGDDAEAAIRFAIQDAIRDGVLVGLSSFSDRLLKSSSNLDSAVSLAESYEKLLKSLDAMKDPLGASVRSVTDELDKMVKMMTTAGATAAELAKVEEYRRLKLDEILKGQLSSLNDFKKSLSGEGSGVSAFNRLTAAQSEFAKMQADIKAGGKIDQEKFTDLGQTIFGLARDVFGSSSSQFQAIRAALIDATDGAITNVTNSFGDATVVAINQQTDAITTNQIVQTDLLNQINQSLARLGGGSVGGDAGAVNGRFVSQVV